MTSLRTTAQRHVQKKVFHQAGLNQATAIERSTSVSTRQRAQFEMYRFDAASYIKDKLGWQVWSGTQEEPGQLQILEAYQKALKQQVEKREYEYDRMALEDLTCYVPGMVIQNRIRVEAGHTVGKTKMFSGLVNHFFDCFPPAIIYCFAPGFTQIHDLLFKEIKADRRGKGLPGRILDMGLQIADNHFCIGRATNDAGGKGTERVQGQHGEYLMFVLDEAEGIPDFVYNAVKSMTSGGIAVVLMAANPRTRASTFYKQKELPNVVNFRISCVSHPNVLQDREIVPGAVKRDYVLDMVESNAEPVPEANPDNHTFTLPFPATKGGKVYEAGTHFEPDTEFLFRVLGIAPANSSDNTFIPVGRYEAACKREEELEGDQLRLGVDVARWGNDFGTIWARRGNHAWRVCKVSKQNSFQYVGPIRRTILAERTRGARNVAVRVDGGGGFGSGVVDILKGDEELKKIFGDLFQVFEVNFNGVAQAPKAYHDIATQMYAESAETIKGLCIREAPKELETDLTARQYKWVNLKGIAVKQLEAKDEFRKRYFRSPDDGDGFVLATAPDFLFRRRIWTFG